MLASVLHRFDCPSPDDLAAYAWHELTGKAGEAVSQHLSICERCTDEYQLLRRSFNLVPAGQTEATLLDQFVERAKWVVARLLPTDARLQPALRGDQAVATAPHIFRVDELGWEVTVMLSPTHDGFAISGSLLGPDETALAQGRATLLQSGIEVSGALLDAAGWFDLTAPTPNDLTLWLELPNERVELVL